MFKSPKVTFTNVYDKKSTVFNKTFKFGDIFKFLLFSLYNIVQSNTRSLLNLYKTIIFFVFIVNLMAINLK